MGPGGLAIARPSAVAIAGVSPEDVSNLGIPIPQKKIIKKNYSVLSSRTLSTTLQNQPESNQKYGATMMKTPYGDIKILVGPSYKAPNSALVDQLKTTMDYSKDNFDEKSESTSVSESDDGEILAEDDQDMASAQETPKITGRDGQFAEGGDKNYDKLMAVAPEEITLNRYPLAPPKFTDYYAPKISSMGGQRRANQQFQSNVNYGQNPAALFYQPLPMNSAGPYNYPYSSLSYPGPMYFGY